jgi:4-amino-4-deoxy-L-arabinose transferase-like glycosyltransferase
MSSKSLPWVMVLTIVIIAGIAKLHLLAMPLERDEGEYAYIAQLLMHGSPLYLNAFSAKLPGIYFVYAAVMMLFGQTPFGIHLGLLILNAASTVLIFLLARRLMDARAGVIAAIAFTLLTIGKYALAFNIEHLAVFFALSGSILMLRAVEKGRGFLLSGLLFGLAFISKQHAAFFALFALLYLAWTLPAKERLKRIFIFLSGAALPFAALCTLFYVQGVFANFWFWVVTYASRYCTFMKFSDGMRSFLYMAGKVMGTAPLIWAAAVFGLFRAGRLERRKALFMAGFFTAALLAITPGLYFRHHYFMFLFPAVALLVGLAARPRTVAVTSLVILVFALTIFQERQFLFKMSPENAVRDIYVKSPINESAEVAKYLEKRSDKDPRVIILGSEPQIYFYLKTRAPVSYIYMYPLLEDTPYAAAMQERFKKEVESAAAEYLVGVHIATSWFNWYANDKISKPLFDWIETYQKEHYDIVGVVDMISRDKTIYIWDSGANTYRPRSDAYMLVFKRKAS